MVFGLDVFVADRLSDCRYLSRCYSPLDSQRVRCREGLAMKSFLIGLFGLLTLFPAIGAVCWYTDHCGAFVAVMFVLFLLSGIGHQRAGAM